ncbi:MAG: hypothetical protein M1376_10830 [Planctomycetes bacterium]|nr:hypothetical protein [Planctomycetota bacterium]
MNTEQYEDDDLEPEDDDSQGEEGVKETVPAYPYSPQLYGNVAKDSPDRLWFKKRGARWDKTGRYLGGFRGK